MNNQRRLAAWQRARQLIEKVFPRHLAQQGCVDQTIQIVGCCIHLYEVAQNHVIACGIETYPT